MGLLFLMDFIWVVLWVLCWITCCGLVLFFFVCGVSILMLLFFRCASIVIYKYRAHKGHSVEAVVGKCLKKGFIMNIYEVNFQNEHGDTISKKISISGQYCVGQKVKSRYLAEKDVLWFDVEKLVIEKNTLENWMLTLLLGGGIIVFIWLIKLFIGYMNFFGDKMMDHISALQSFFF